MAAMTRGSWSESLLRALGNNSPDARTINFVAAWTKGENTDARFNPLATTQPMPGSTCFNCPLANVQNYSSHQQGIDATVKTLNNGRYPHVLEGLKTNDPEQSVNAIELGTWGTGLGFTNLWRLADYRTEELKSHRFGEGTSSGGSWDDTYTPPLEIPNPNTEVVKLLTGDDTAFPSTKNIAKNVTYIGIGGVFLFIAVMLAIRTFVPVQQVVKTVAAVA